MFQARKRITFLLVIFLAHQHNAYDLPEEIGKVSISSRQNYNPEQTEYYNEDFYHRYDKDGDSDEPESQEKISPMPKSRKEDGWKPIIGGRSADRNNDMLKTQHAAQLQKLRERYLEYLNTKSEQVATTTENRLKWERNVNRDHPKASSWDYNVNSQMYVGSNRQPNFTKTYEKTLPPSDNYRFKENSYNTVEPKVPEFRDIKVEKKPKMLKEDDIMWMHYGPPSEENYPRYHTTRHEKLTTIEPTTDMNYREREEPDKKTADWLEYGLQYFLNYPREGAKGKKSPKNIYEIIDKNNQDDFKPVSGVNKRHTRRGSLWEQQFEDNENRKSDDHDRLIENSEAAEPTDDESWHDLYKAIYGPEGNSEREKETENEIKIEKEPENVKNTDVKSKAQSLGGFVDNYHNVEPPHAFSKVKPTLADKKTNEQKYYHEDESDKKPEPSEVPTTEKIIHDSWWSHPEHTKSDHKSGKLLGKPIVIVEPSLPETRLTAEYYRKLFDSFGGHDDTDYKGNTKKNLPHNQPAEHNATGGRKNENSLKDYFEPPNDLNRVPKSYSPKDELEVKQDSITNETATQKTSEDCSSKAERKNRNISPEKSENSTNTEKPKHKHGKIESFRIFKFIGIDIKDLVPKTLRTNFFLMNKLLADCYSGNDKENSDGYVSNCLKKITSRALDKAIGSEVIKITDAVSLVKENVTGSAEDESRLVIRIFF